MAILFSSTDFDILNRKKTLDFESVDSHIYIYMDIS